MVLSFKLRNVTSARFCQGCTKSNLDKRTVTCQTHSPKTLAEEHCGNSVYGGVGRGLKREERFGTMCPANASQLARRSEIQHLEACGHSLQEKRVK